MDRSTWTRMPVYCLVLLITQAGASGAEEVTGSHLDSRVVQPQQVDINDPDYIDMVYQLLQSGDVPGAVVKARENLRRLERENSPSGSLQRYLALNALCSALSKSGQLPEAILACTEAIAIRPDRWTAINNRGTARYLAGSYREALADYRAALRVAPDTPAIIETIQHNIDLGEGKLAARDD